jgi:excisionase family DNA binding protein
MIEAAGQNEVAGGLLTSQQAAKWLAISERTLFAWVKAGRIVAVRLGMGTKRGRGLRFDPADLRAFVESMKTRLATDLPKETANHVRPVEPEPVNKTTVKGEPGSPERLEERGRSGLRAGQPKEIRIVRFDPELAMAASSA